MSSQPPCVLVLWADQFAEAVAVLFVTGLREAGIRVKLISLTRRPTKGEHGLALVPDLTLQQALPLLPQALYLVIPATLQTLRRHQHDPRLEDFFEQVYTGPLNVLVAPGETFEDPKNTLAVSVQTFPAESPALLEFIQEMVATFPVVAGDEGIAKIR